MHLLGLSSSLWLEGIPRLCTGPRRQLGWAGLGGQMGEEEEREGETWAEGALEHENQKDRGE